MTLWWIVLGISVAVYAALAGIIFSRAFFAVTQKHSLDRGLMSFKEKNGKSIVFEPKPEYRKYMSQYILSFRNGKTSILCKLSDEVNHIDYDIVLFNDADKAFKVINVKESIEKQGLTHEVDLPPKTSYASVVINGINNALLNGSGRKNLLSRRTAVFSATNGALTLIEVFFVKLCLANIFADVFAADFMTSVSSILITLAIAAVISFATIPAAAVYITLKDRRRRAHEL